MGRTATSTRRATAMFSRSLGVGSLRPLPRAASTLRMPRTMAVSSPGSSEARWSGPGMARSRVKCFSTTAAPSATAARAHSIPGVWSE
jgi:hypothetical protein